MGSNQDLKSFNAGGPVYISPDEAVTAASLGLPPGEFIRYYPEESGAYHFFRSEEDGRWEAARVGVPFIRVHLQPGDWGNVLSELATRLPLVGVHVTRELNDGLFYKSFQEALEAILSEVIH